MTDYIDKIIHSEPDVVRDAGTVNKLGIRRANVMAVPDRTVSAEDIEKRERDYLAAPEFPLAFWDGDDGTLEPLMTSDYAALKAAGISPEEWEICILEDQLERNRK